MTIASYFNDTSLAEPINAVVALGLGAAGHVAWQALKDYVRGHKSQLVQVVTTVAEDVLHAEEDAASQKAHSAGEPAAEAEQYAPGDAPATDPAAEGATA